MDISVQLAGIIGPILVVLAISEYLNFEIWKGVHPTTVYLNGLVLLTLGLTITRFHNVWTLDWKIVITMIGWLLVLLGLTRMFLPEAKQLEKNIGSSIVLLILLIIGAFLSVKGYVFT